MCVSAWLCVPACVLACVCVRVCVCVGVCACAWNPQLKPGRLAPLLRDLFKLGGLCAQVWSAHK